MSETPQPRIVEQNAPNVSALPIGRVSLSETVSFLDSPLELVEFKEGVQLPNKIAGGQEIGDKVRDDLAARRDKILEIPSNEAGIDMDRIDQYRQLMGAPKKAIRILSESDYKKALEMAGVGDVEHNDSQGGYLPLLDVIIVKRNEAEDAEYGTGLIESVIVHEIAHSSGEYPAIGIQKETRKRFGRKAKVAVAPFRARSGFIVTNNRDGDEGDFLEEGYAEFERGQYIKNVLHLPDGFTKHKMPDIEGAQIFNKYLGPKGLNGVNEPETLGSTEGLREGDSAAVILELLVSVDPQLLDALRASRREPQGLRDVARRIDNIVPGLYQEMRKHRKDSEGAADKAAMLWHKTYLALRAFEKAA